MILHLLENHVEGMDFATIRCDEDVQFLVVVGVAHVGDDVRKDGVCLPADSHRPRCGDIEVVGEYQFIVVALVLEAHWLSLVLVASDVCLLLVHCSHSP